MIEKLLESSWQILREFGSLTLMVLPYFVLGVIIGALLKTFLKPGFVVKYFSSIINASILGAVLPGCACTVIPIADGLKEKGIKLGTLSAFIMIAPLLSPHTVLLTYSLLGLNLPLPG